MSEFEKWLEENYPIAGLDMCEKEGDRYTHKPTRNMHDAYLAGQQTKEAAIREMDEVIKMQDADLRKYEKQVEGLKEQLNNMEACYIQVKKERDELHSATDKALTHVKRQTECFRDLKTDATDMQTKNWWQAKVQILNPIRRMLEAALRGTNG